MWSCVLEESADEEDRSERSRNRKSASIKSTEKTLHWKDGSPPAGGWVTDIESGCLDFQVWPIFYLVHGASAAWGNPSDWWVKRSRAAFQAGTQEWELVACGLSLKKKKKIRVGRSEVVDNWREWKTFIWRETCHAHFSTPCCYFSSAAHRNKRSSPPWKQHLNHNVTLTFEWNNRHVSRYKVSEVMFFIQYKFTT